MALVFGCNGTKPQPLGKLPRSELSSWAEDCPTPIVEKPAIKGPDPAMWGLEREMTFQQATHRFVCDAPGWIIYADASDRVVGLCVDNDMRQERGMRDELSRARPLIKKHWGPELAEKMTQGTCYFAPERVGPFLRWNQNMPSVKQPDGTWAFAPPTGALWSCCWEVVD